MEKILDDLGVSIILLVHNEAEVIEKVIREFYDEVMKKLPKCELIVAEDGSTDGTKEILLKLDKELPITLLMAKGRRGYIQAMKDAFNASKYGLIFFSDSDGQHEAKDFWRLVTKINDYDIVIGQKHPRTDPFYRVWLAWFYNFFIRTYFGLKIHDIDSGFRLVKKDKLKEVFQEEWFFKDLIASEITLRAVSKESKITEVPIHHHLREFGESRGIPNKKVPRVIFETLSGFVRLKKEFKLQEKRSS